MRNRYLASRGGHAPGHLREAFEEWIEAGAKSDTVKIDDRELPLKWLIGQLWNCSDVLPSYYCDDLDIHQGSSYASAVRGLK